MNVSRYTDTTELRFDVEFVTPCFLGGAYGNAEIRTAPFKNLLRRWWRIANGNLSPEELWKRESRLFGSTEKDPDIVAENKKLPKSEQKPEIFGKSKVELKIEVFPPENHTSIEKINIGKDRSADLAMYTGYGSVNMGKTYIKPNTRCSFVLSCPSKCSEKIRETLFYIHLFGTIGSRSRNAWGSIAIVPKSFHFEPGKYFPKPVFFIDILSSNKHYPTCIGSDKKGMLCWQTEERYGSWESAFEDVAVVYHRLVSDLKNDDGEYQTKWRDLLGFATANDRLPSQLLLKICKAPKRIPAGNILKGCYEYYGQIVHIPYSVEDWKDENGNQQEAWEYIHDWLDKEERLSGCMGRKTKGVAK